MINKTPWRVAAYEGGWTGIDDVGGQQLFRLAYNNDENANHAVACVNAFHESGISPADLPKFVEAVRFYKLCAETDSRNSSWDLYEKLSRAAACLPENKR